MTALLTLEDVDAFYGAAHILHRLSLHVAAGERVALIGRNGVGKTTVVNTILGLAQLTAKCLVIEFAGNERKCLEMRLALAFGDQQGEQNIDGLVVDSIESNGSFQLDKHAHGPQRILFEFAVGNCNAVANPGTAHFLTRQDRFEDHLWWQAQLLCSQFTDNFQGTFFALAVNLATGTFLVKDIAQL